MFSRLKMDNVRSERRLAPVILSKTRRKSKSKARMPRKMQTRRSQNQQPKPRWKKRLGRDITAMGRLT